MNQLLSAALLLRCCVEYLVLSIITCLFCPRVFGSSHARACSLLFLKSGPSLATLYHFSGGKNIFLPLQRNKTVRLYSPKLAANSNGLVKSKGLLIGPFWSVLVRLGLFRSNRGLLEISGFFEHVFNLLRKS